MTVFEVLSVAISTGNRVDIQLGLFITVHLAIFGGILYVDRPLRLPEKIGAIAIYVPFALLHYRIMRQQLNLLTSAYFEVAERAATNDTNNVLLRYIADDVASGRLADLSGILIVGHITMGLLVVLAVAFDTSLSKMSPGTGKQTRD